MLRIKFFGSGGEVDGFELFGHATVNADDFDGKIVCSAVSSAVYMTANTLTEIIGEKIDVVDEGDTFRLMLLTKKSESQTVMKGFKLHIEALFEQYGNMIKID